jgi:hypothetical protein
MNIDFEIFEIPDCKRSGEDGVDEYEIPECSMTITARSDAEKINEIKD